MSPGEKRKIKARITIAEDSSAKVIKAEVLQENSGLALELIPLEDGKNYDLWVSSPENLEKSFYYSIKIHTDSKKTPIKHISVNGYVPGPLNIPKSLFFTKRPSETNRVTRSIRIMPGTVKNFTVLDATWPEEDVEVKITHLGESRGSQITFSNIKVSTSLNGKKVTVKTDVPKLEEVNIPLRVNTMPDK